MELYEGSKTKNKYYKKLEWLHIVLTEKNVLLTTGYCF